MAAYEAIEREPVARPLPRRRGAHQPAAVLGRHPDRLRARPAGAARRRARDVEQLVAPRRRPTTRRTEEFAEGLHDEAYVRSVLDDQLGSTTHLSVLDADGMCASVTCSNGTGSGLVVPGHRRPRQQHARRGGPEPGRLPPDPARPPGELDDGADGGPARRRGRARARQRRLQPDPLGDPADGRPGARAGHGRRGGRAGAAACTSRQGTRAGRARGRRGRARQASRPGASRWSAGAGRTSTSAASRPSPATRPAASSAAAATPPRRRRGGRVAPEADFDTDRGAGLAPQPKSTLPFERAWSATASARSSASSTALSALASSSIRSSSSRVSSSSCFVSAGSSIRAAIA